MVSFWNPLKILLKQQKSNKQISSFQSLFAENILPISCHSHYHPFHVPPNASRPYETLLPLHNCLSYGKICFIKVCFFFLSDIILKQLITVIFTIWKKPGGDCIVYVASCLDGCKRCWWLIAIF